MREKAPYSIEGLKASNDERGLEIEQEILQAIRGIRYGSVEVIIHDSKVVQIERKEKIRFDNDGSGKGR